MRKVPGVEPSGGRRRALGQLRDGSWIAGSERVGAGTTSCNLLDRIHDFQYRYVRGGRVRAAASSDNP